MSKSIYEIYVDQDPKPSLDHQNNIDNNINKIGWHFEEFQFNVKSHEN